MVANRSLLAHDGNELHDWIEYTCLNAIPFRCLFRIWNLSNYYGTTNFQNFKWTGNKFPRNKDEYLFSKVKTHTQMSVRKANEWMNEWWMLFNTWWMFTTQPPSIKCNCARNENELYGRSPVRIYSMRCHCGKVLSSSMYNKYSWTVVFLPTLAKFLFRVFYWNAPDFFG